MQLKDSVNTIEKTDDYKCDILTSYKLTDQSRTVEHLLEQKMPNSKEVG